MTICSFISIVDEGLHDLIRECIEMGSVYGTTLPTKSIMPHPTTISRSVRQIAEDKREELKSFVRKYYNQGKRYYYERQQHFDKF